MKISAYIAASLPFVLLLILIAVVLGAPRLQHSTTRLITATTLPTIVVHASTSIPVETTFVEAASAGADGTWHSLPTAARLKSTLRMPYFSFARDLGLGSER